LYHLQLELQRIDLQLQRAVQRWKRAGQDPEDAFRGLYVSDEQAEALLARPLGGNWGEAIGLPDELARSLDRREEQVARKLEGLRREANQHQHPLPLHHLQEAFNLTPFDLDALLIALAPSLDLRYERIYGYLQDDVSKKRPTVNLVLDLLSQGGIGRLTWLARFEAKGPLVRHRLIELQAPAQMDRAPLLAHSLSVDEGLLSFLLGSYHPHPDLIPHTALHLPTVEEARPLLDPDIEAALAQPGPATLYTFHGVDHTAQRAAAGYISAQHHRPLLRVELGESRDRLIRLALRDARLIGAVVMFEDWDTPPNEARPSAEQIPADWLQMLYEFPGVLILAGDTQWLPKGSVRDRRVAQQDFPIPPYGHRRSLWERFLDPSAAVDDPDLDALAGQFMLTTGQIRDAASTAEDRAVQGDHPVARVDLFAAARAHSNVRLAALAKKIAPRFSWEDIVLPDDQLALLREIINTVRGRPKVLDTWGVGEKLASSRGVTVLFSGPPGTGKTMAAEIIADELGLDLYKIDLSTVVSKYIGETEKNIERIFKEAERSNAILFFDEADALFGKRSEVRDSHDRYANIEISYLLQRMEAYDGVTILATNLRGNLDEAFTRRLQFAVNFPFPEADDRLRIWRTLFPEDVPRAPDLDFEYLAERFRLAGGSIRNIIVSAAYLAAADGHYVTMNHLLHGTRRELQKMGRLIREEDLDIPA
jgi:ATP-dependent 26S proteasome regulatory subunit